MGVEIDRDSFDEADYASFEQRLADQVEALRRLLARPGFGVGEETIGAELELDLVDARARPLHANRAVLAATRDPRVTLELAKFNLEINSCPVPLSGRPFRALAAEIDGVIAMLEGAAATQGARIAAIGILPTLEPADLAPSAITDARRYRALSAAIRRVRGAPFHVRIEGDDPLVLDVDDVTLEGATTSFQAHLRVAPEDFARTYNAAQIATAPALAVGANSPTFLGHRLWDETRIALFRQSVDDRAEATSDWRPSRVSFGHGWVRQGIAELFEESIALHAPLLPLDDGEDALAVVRGARIPRLAALRLHNGTTWRWNRPVYDETAGGHLRIEMRALPAGPTTVDALATAAFLIGLTLGLAPHADRIVHRLTFGQARRNFYEAARHGLDAEILWPSEAVPSPRPVRAVDLVPTLLPLARHGLLSHGVADDEAEAMLGVIAARVASRTTGARWQRAALSVLPRAEMLERYLANAATRKPVHTWPQVLP